MNDLMLSGGGCGQVKEDHAFRDVFVDGWVPLRGGPVRKVELEGHPGTHRVYMVDLGRLTTDQIEEIARRMGKAEGVDPAEVEKEIRERGLPIRESSLQCSMVRYFGGQEA